MGILQQVSTKVSTIPASVFDSTMGMLGAHGGCVVLSILARLIRLCPSLSIFLAVSLSLSLLDLSLTRCIFSSGILRTTMN